MTNLAVVVPVLDEAQTLPGLLDALAAQRGVALALIVADGGSRDASPAIADAAGATVVCSARGRGRQMNAGAARAAAPWLLFLHADCRPTYPEQLADALAAMQAAGSGLAAGHFALRFTATGRPRFLYRYMQAKSATGRAYTVNGDQGLLIGRAAFERLGGFDESLGFLEDQRLAARISEKGQWLLLPGSLATSARRFEAEGPRQRYFLMAMVMAMYANGLQQFFARAPGVYRAQSQAQPLLLTPYFRLIRALMRELGWRASLRHWLATGAFVAGQSWQLFFAVDVALARPFGNRRPLTALQDRLLAPLLRNRAGAALAAALAFGVSMGLLAPWYRWRERGYLRAGLNTGRASAVGARAGDQPGDEAQHRQQDNDHHPDNLGKRTGAAADCFDDSPDVGDQNQYRQ